MGRTSRIKKGIYIELALLLLVVTAALGIRQRMKQVETGFFQEKEDYIKWVDFTVSYEALCLAYELDVESYGQPVHLDWIELLSYGAARSGGKFDNGTLRTIQKFADALTARETTLPEAVAELKHYSYYKEAYTAVLGGMVGEYEIEEADAAGQKRFAKKYGLKAFSPIAMGFPYNDYDDFGTSRSYGYKRQHLGHDMMGQVGTPVIAVESGYVEALGWNQYGGWRIGIRSFDGKRYYYYAHLRQNYPYCQDLKEGSVVTAGDVIGYMGHTGYSNKENVNNIKTVHLHWGLQLIFDESQKEGNNEIWIDCYPLSRFLYKNRSEAAKVEGTKEWRRLYQMKDPAAEAYRSSGSSGTKGSGTVSGSTAISPGTVSGSSTAISPGTVSGDSTAASPGTVSGGSAAAESGTAPAGSREGTGGKPEATGPASENEAEPIMGEVSGNSPEEKEETEAGNGLQKLFHRFFG